MHAELRWCADCSAETFFEQPPCQDGHGEDCLDLACVECGAALVIGVLIGESTVTVTAHAA